MNSIQIAKFKAQLLQIGQNEFELFKKKHLNLDLNTLNQDSCISFWNLISEEQFIKAKEFQNNPFLNQSSSASATKSTSKFTVKTIEKFKSCQTITNSAPSKTDITLETINPTFGAQKILNFRVQCCTGDEFVRFRNQNPQIDCNALTFDTCRLFALFLIRNNVIDITMTRLFLEYNLVTEKEAINTLAYYCSTMEELEQLLHRNFNSDEVKKWLYKKIYVLGGSLMIRQYFINHCSALEFMDLITNKSHNVRVFLLELFETSGKCNAEDALKCIEICLNEKVSNLAKLFITKALPNQLNPHTSFGEHLLLTSIEKQCFDITHILLQFEDKPFETNSVLNNSIIKYCRIIQPSNDNFYYNLLEYYAKNNGESDMICAIMDSDKISKTDMHHFVEYPIVFEKLKLLLTQEIQLLVRCSHLVELLNLLSTFKNSPCLDVNYTIDSKTALEIAYNYRNYGTCCVLLGHGATFTQFEPKVQKLFQYFQSYYLKHFASRVNKNHLFNNELIAYAIQSSYFVNNNDYLDIIKSEFYYFDTATKELSKILPSWLFEVIQPKFSNIFA